MVLAARDAPMPIASPRVPLNAWCISVLVVDDDEADQAMAVEALRRIREVSAIAVRASAERALTDLASRKLTPDLILLDVSMPRTDGFGFLRRLQNVRCAHDIPVAMLTTSRMRSDVELSKDHQVCAYIVKPEDPDEWRMRIERVVVSAMAGTLGRSR